MFLMFLLFIPELTGTQKGSTTQLLLSLPFYGVSYLDNDLDPLLDLPLQAESNRRVPSECSIQRLILTILSFFFFSLGPPSSREPPIILLLDEQFYGVEALKASISSFILLSSPSFLFCQSMSFCNSSFCFSLANFSSYMVFCRAIKSFFQPKRSSLFLSFSCYVISTLCTREFKTFLA